MSISEISVQDLAALGPAARIVDVREPDEWEAGHIPHATHVQLGTVPDNVEQFDGSPTYVICLAGGRSQRACEFVAERGGDVVNVAGGMRAWSEAGFDVVPGTPGSDGG
ncbi:MAG: rhodanese-like domain-containing protein [Ilumatobacteraceae bacterium]